MPMLWKANILYRRHHSTEALQWWGAAASPQVHPELTPG